MGESGLEASTEKLNVSPSLKICGNGTVVSHSLVQGQVQLHMCQSILYVSGGSSNSVNDN